MAGKQNYGSSSFGKGKCVVRDDSEEEYDDVVDSISDCGLSLEKLNLGRRKELLVLNLNGLLVHRVHHRRLQGFKEVSNNRRPDGTYGNFLGIKICVCVCVY